MHLEGGSVSFRALPLSHASSPSCSLPSCSHGLFCRRKRLLHWIISKGETMDRLSSPPSSQPRTHFPGLQPSPPCAALGDAGAVQHTAFGTAALCGFWIWLTMSVPRGAAHTHAALRWSAKNTQQSCSPCSQSDSPGSTGMAVQLHRSRREIWEENHVSVE